MVSFRNPNRLPPAPPLSADSIWDIEFRSLGGRGEGIAILQGVRHDRRTGSIYWAQDGPLRSKKMACSPPLEGPLLTRHYFATPTLHAMRLWRYCGFAVHIRSHTF